MSKKVPYLAEVGLGLIITALVAFTYHKGTGFSETLSLKIFDVLSSKRKPHFKTDDIRIVEIDKESADSIGRWPWPRAVQAQLVDEVVAAGAKVIGLNILYAEVDQSQGLD